MEELTEALRAWSAWLADFNREYQGRALLYGQAAADAWRDGYVAQNGAKA